MAGIILILFPILFANAEFAAYPACPKVSKEIWVKNQNGCSSAFSAALSSGHLDTTAVSEVCGCFADELVNKLTCEEIDLFKSDTQYAQATDERIKTYCASKTGLDEKLRRKPASAR